MRNLPRLWISRSPTTKLSKALTAPPAYPQPVAVPYTSLGAWTGPSEERHPQSWSSRAPADFLAGTLLLKRANEPSKWRLEPSIRPQVFRSCRTRLIVPDRRLRFAPPRCNPGTEFGNGPCFQYRLRSRPRVYDQNYQNEQGCSPRFQTHLDEVERIIRRHLEGKTYRCGLRKRRISQATLITRIRNNGNRSSL